MLSLACTGFTSLLVISAPVVMSLPMSVQTLGLSRLAGMQERSVLQHKLLQEGTNISDALCSTRTASSVLLLHRWENRHSEADFVLVLMILISNLQWQKLSWIMVKFITTISSISFSLDRILFILHERLRILFDVPPPWYFIHNYLGPWHTSLVNHSTDRTTLLMPHSVKQVFYFITLFVFSKKKKGKLL